EWNAAGRMQGRHDIQLSAAAHAGLTGLALPPDLAGFSWRVSPLLRARETAAALGITDVRIEPRLLEMDWGAWEGRTLAGLRAQPGGAMAAAEAAGLDFRPPGGESPRDLQHRLAPLLCEIAAADMPVAAVTHKGVIRALLAIATAWDMRGKAPVRLD